MKRALLRKLSENLEQIMHKKGISPKQLSEASKIGYSSLIPILNGSRDCGVSKLIAIANALGCSTNTLLDDFLTTKNDDFRNTSIHATKTNPKYIAVFISAISVTYCLIYDAVSKNKKITMLKFDLGCGQTPDVFLDNIVTSIQDVLHKEFKAKVDTKNIAVFTSVQQYEWAENRTKIQKGGDNLFAKFIIESDAITNYHALFHNKSGILITINDGDGITYSSDKGKNIIKVQGYGFPVSDVAGNDWIGCEAIKHVINVKENVEPSSLISDKILALFNDDIYLLSESLAKDVHYTYSKASAIVRELACENQKAQEIIKLSTNLLLKRISLIDEQLKIKLPIALTGDLANIYKGFFPTNRMVTLKDNVSSILLNYGLEALQKACETK